MLVRIALLFGSSLVQQICSLRWGGWQPWCTGFTVVMYMGRLLFGWCIFPPIGLIFAQRKAWWFWLAWMVMSRPHFQCVFSCPPPSCPGLVDSLTVFLAFFLWGVPWLFPQSLACACEWVLPWVLAMLRSFHFSQSMVSRTWHELEFHYGSHQSTYQHNEIALLNGPPQSCVASATTRRMLVLSGCRWNAGHISLLDYIRAFKIPFFSLDVTTGRWWS